MIYINVSYLIKQNQQQQNPNTLPSINLSRSCGVVVGVSSYGFMGLGNGSVGWNRASVDGTHLSSYNIIIYSRSFLSISLGGGETTKID